MPSTTPTTEPMPAERSGLLAEFARACKAAAPTTTPFRRRSIPGITASIRCCSCERRVL